MTYLVKKTPVLMEYRRAVKLLKEFETMRDAVTIVAMMDHGTLGEYMRAMGVSQPTATRVFREMIDKRYFMSTSPSPDSQWKGRTRLRVEITSNGRALLGDVALRMVAMGVNLEAPLKVRKLESEKEAEAVLLLRKIAMDKTVGLKEAIELEDGGLCERVPGRKIRITNTGFDLLRRGARGPLLNNGNRTTMIVLGKKDDDDGDQEEEVGKEDDDEVGGEPGGFEVAPKPRRRARNGRLDGARARK